jgi:hypothetical protein
MEWILITLAIILAIYLSTSERMEALRFRYAYIVFFVVYPIFFYLVVLRDFTWIKLILFLIMLTATIYSYFVRKARLAANEVQRPS